jgi:hypothetical protein
MTKREKLLYDALIDQTRCLIFWHHYAMNDKAILDHDVQSAQAHEEARRIIAEFPKTKRKKK